MQRKAYPLPLVQRYLDFKISTSKIHKAEELLYIDFNLFNSFNLYVLPTL